MAKKKVAPEFQFEGTSYERYQALTEATDEQCEAAFKKAREWLAHSGNTHYNDCQSAARGAVAEYLLYKDGLRAKRYSWAELAEKDKKEQAALKA